MAIYADYFYDPFGNMELDGLGSGEFDIHKPTLFPNPSNLYVTDDTVTLAADYNNLIFRVDEGFTQLEYEISTLLYNSQLAKQYAIDGLGVLVENGYYSALAYSQATKSTVVDPVVGPNGLALVEDSIDTTYTNIINLNNTAAALNSSATSGLESKQNDAKVIRDNINVVADSAKLIYEDLCDKFSLRDQRGKLAYPCNKLRGLLPTGVDDIGSGLTYTRTGTCWNLVNGQFKNVPLNTPPITSDGLLIEPACTNEQASTDVQKAANGWFVFGDSLTNTNSISYQIPFEGYAASSLGFNITANSVEGFGKDYDYASGEFNKTQEFSVLVKSNNPDLVKFRIELSSYTWYVISYPITGKNFCSPGEDGYFNLGVSFNTNNMTASVTSYSELQNSDTNYSGDGPVRYYPKIEDIGNGWYLLRIAWQIDSSITSSSPSEQYGVQLKTVVDNAGNGSSDFIVYNPMTIFYDHILTGYENNALFSYGTPVIAGTSRGAATLQLPDAVVPGPRQDVKISADVSNSPESVIDANNTSPSIYQNMEWNAVCIGFGSLYDIAKLTDTTYIHQALTAIPTVLGSVVSFDGVISTGYSAQDAAHGYIETDSGNTSYDVMTLSSDWDTGITFGTSAGSGKSRPTVVKNIRVQG